MNKAEDTLNQLLEKDVDESLSEVATLLPSIQLSISAIIFDILSHQSPQNQEIGKYLRILQVISSSPYLTANGSDALKKFELLIFWAQKSSSDELKQQLLTSATHIFNSTGESKCRISKDTIDRLGLLSEENDDRVKSISSTIAIRIKNAQSENYCFSVITKHKFPNFDIKQAAKNVRSDIYGDWYQDPWAWPEVEWLGDAGKDKVASRMKEDTCGWSVAFDVPKPHGGLRPALLLNPLDRITYQCLADEVSDEVSESLPDWVYGWRLDRKSPQKAKYESTPDEWGHFSRRLSTLTQSYDFKAHVDIQSFFSTTSIPALLVQLGRRYRNPAVLGKLDLFLHSLQGQPHGKGLPQRCLASSLLSHVALRPIDAFLQRFSKSGRSNSIVPSRWMDDIWIHGNDENELKCLVSEIENILHHSGFSLNSTKTTISPSGDGDQILDPQQFYIQDSHNPTSLNKILDYINEGDIPAFAIGMISSVMYKKKSYEALSTLLDDNFQKISPWGDKLAKLFLGSGEWKRITTDYLSFARQHISKENLAVASWAEMFPNTPEHDLLSVHNFFSETISDGKENMLTPLAAHKISTWKNAFSTESLAEPETIENNEDSFSLRAIAFAGLKIGMPKETVKLALEKSETTTLDFLMDRNFFPPPTSKRFGG